MGLRSRISIGWLAAALVPAAAMAETITFDTPGELTSRFSLNTNNGNPVKFAQVATGGLGNSGAVDYLPTTESDHTTAVFNEQSYSFANPGDSISDSHFLLRRNCTAAQTPWTHLGIVGDLNERMDAGTASNSFASLRFDPVSSALATDVQLRTETKVNGGSRLRTNLGPVFSLTAGNWYRVATTYSYVDGTSMSMSATVEDWGTSGASLQSTVLSTGAASVALSGLDAVNSDGSVWAGFRDFHDGGADLSDDLSIVPEPGTLGGLLMLALALPRGRRE